MDVTKISIEQELNLSSATPLYLQIADIILNKIEEGLLAPGNKLPPERTLAKLFSVSRTTAINAYRHLEQEGLVNTKVGSGTYVAEFYKAGHKNQPSIPWDQLFIPHLKNPLSSILRSLVSEFTAKENISLAVGMPDPSLYPIQIFEDLFKRNMQRLDPLDFGHISTEGYLPLRESVAKLQNQKGILATSENILILAGSQQGVYLLNKTFLEPGDYVVVESPTYIGAIQAFQNSGARILTLPRLQDLPLSLLEDYIIRYRPKFFYTIPTFQNPTGYTLSLSQRKELLELAARYQLIIIEDDPYSELYYEQQPPPSLKALDHYGIVIYLGTFSKILFPGLRTGWLVGPPVLINRLAQEKQYIDLHCNNLVQWLLYLFLEENNLVSHLPGLRQEYKKRRDAMADSIKRFCKNKLDFVLPEGGFYLWCQIPDSITSSMLLHESAKTGVSFVPGEAFYTNQAGNNGIRLCFATHQEKTLVEGIKRLGSILDQAPRIKHTGQKPLFVTGRPII